MTALVGLHDLAPALGLGAHEHVAIVGGGGKTLTLFALADGLRGRRIVTTTTKMGPRRRGGIDVLFSPTDDALRDALAEERAVIAWSERDDRKVLGYRPEVCDRWFAMFDHVLVEADGSRQRPFKAPSPHEPVIPSSATVVLALIGASALGRPIAEVCHRPERVAGLVDCWIDDELTPERAASVLVHPEGSRQGCPDAARFVALIANVTDGSRQRAELVRDLVTTAEAPATAGRASAEAHCVARADPVSIAHWL